MSGTDRRTLFLYELPPPVHCEFCRTMDVLSDQDWTRFASEVLLEQDDVRLAERKERRTECVMNQWGARNGRVCDLINLLQRLRLLRPCDVILGWTNARCRASPAPPPPYTPPPPPPPPPPPDSSPRFDVPSSSSTASTVRAGRQTEDKGGGGSGLPRPAPPPSHLRTNHHVCSPSEVLPPVEECGDAGVTMCWSYEEVHAGTRGFSPSLKVGEGGFGVVYRATLGTTDCAVKRLKQDSALDWTLLRQTFQTEVEKLSKFRHPNIVDLLGVCEGGGSLCLIYSYMDNISLEEQLHNQCVVLSWPQRLSIIRGVASALAFLHSPPDKQAALIHGDVKSANILLDRHLEAKLADFGLARLCRPAPSGRSASRTASLGSAQTVRGTPAYLPDEYLRGGRLAPAVDVYGFGVVLLEVLTGRRALQRDGAGGDRYLKDLVKEVEHSPGGSCAAEWRKHLDQRLVPGGPAGPGAEGPGAQGPGAEGPGAQGPGAEGPAQWSAVLALACSCLDRKGKRPGASEVFRELRDIYNLVTGASSCSSSCSSSSCSSSSSSSSSCSQDSARSLRPPTSSMDSRVEALSSQVSQLGPLRDTGGVPRPTSSGFGGPCESDESRGFSQFRSDGTGSSSSSSSLAPPTDGCGQSEFSSVPTEDQYNFPPLPGGSADTPGAGGLTGPHDDKGLYGGPGYFSPVGSLQSLDPSGWKEQKRTQGAELQSSDDLYGEGGASGSRQPEESDELGFLPGQ